MDFSLEPRVQHLLHLGDNALILGQRLSEWCGHGPVLELDIAIINTALDHLGQARMLLQHAGKQLEPTWDEDKLAFFRTEKQFFNFLMLELPNGDWAKTMVRQFLFDTYNYVQYEALLESSDSGLKAIAGKAIKEIRYHVQFSAEWVIRMGDGTEESHLRAQNALEELWPYTGEFFESDGFSEHVSTERIAPLPQSLQALWKEKVSEVLLEAGLTPPELSRYRSGGRRGAHTEHMGYILADMQYLPRLHPQANW